MLFRKYFFFLMLIFMFGCSELKNLREISRQQDQKIRDQSKEIEDSNKKYYETVKKMNQMEISKNKEIDDLKEKNKSILADMSKKETDYKTEIVKNKNDMDQLKTEFQGKLSDMQGTLEQKDNEIKALKVKEQEAQQLALKVDELQKLSATKDNEKNVMSQEIKNKQSEIDKLKTDLNKLNEDLKSKTASEEEAKKKVSDLEGKLTNLQAESEEAKQVKAEIEKIKSDMQQKKGITPEQLQTLKSAFDDIQASLAEEIKAGSCSALNEGKGIIIRIPNNSIYESDNVIVKDSSKPLLQKIGAILNKYDIPLITVEGHTDDTPIGNLPFYDNLALSSARADNLTRFLIEELKVSPSKLKSVACSYYHPIAPNNTPEGRQKNRRVDIILSY